MTAPTTEQPEKAVFVKGFYTPSDLREMADRLAAPSAPAEPQGLYMRGTEARHQHTAIAEHRAASPQVEQTPPMFTEQDVADTRLAASAVSKCGAEATADRLDDLANRISRSLAPSTGTTRGVTPADAAAS